MRICILTREPKNYTNRRLKEAVERRGHKVYLVNPLRCYMNINSAQPMVYYRSHKLDRFDAVIPRIGASITFYGCAVVRQFEMMNVFTLNPSLAISRSRDKLRASQLLAKKGIGLPVTGFAHSTNESDDLIQMVGGAPIVVKLLEGTQGKGVVLAETERTAVSVINAFRGLDAHFLVQEFVKEAGGCDIRCFVIGDRVVASMIRRAKEGDFRSNLHAGGSASFVKTTRQERSIAIQAVKAMGLEVAGVDLLRSAEGPLVLEVNSSPGLEGIEKATGRDIAGMVVEHIAKRVAQGGRVKNKIE